jgi:hypothetical protein
VLCEPDQQLPVQAHRHCRRITVGDDVVGSNITGASDFNFIERKFAGVFK